MPYQAPTWRAEERRRFVDVLVETGNPAVAAAAIGQSLASAYAMRDRSAAFAGQWQRALGVAWEQVENRVLANLLDGAAAGIDAKVALEMLKRRPVARPSAGHGDHRRAEDRQGAQRNQGLAAVRMTSERKADGMADRRTSHDDVPALWAGATPAGRRAVVRRNSEPVVAAALHSRDELRPNQLPPDGDWSIWVILAGRGFGKTRAGAEWVHAMALERPRRFALVGTSLDNARAVMVEGELGLLARMPAGGDVNFLASQRLLSWHNGSQARLFSGGEPDSLRGGQFDFAWGDEFAHWPHAEETLTNLRLATRLGTHPRLLLTTTPLPHVWLKDLIAEPGVMVTRGRMADNAANLPPDLIASLQRRYGDTATGRQELDGEIIEDLAGALWTRSLIERQRAPAPEQFHARGCRRRSAGRRCSRDVRHRCRRA